MIFLKGRTFCARLFILAIGVFLLVAATCKADIIYDFDLDTSGLVGNANAPFALDFQLTSGDTPVVL